jgi:multiple sugar transport system permease protein
VNSIVTIDYPHSPVTPEIAALRLPRVMKARQCFVGPELCDIPAAVRGEMERVNLAACFNPAARVAITVGSRGISSIPQVAAGIFAFTLSWNEFIYALVFLSSATNKTIPVGVVSELAIGDYFFWGPLMAGALLGSVPVAFIYSFFVEQYVSAMTGAVKG